VQKHNRIHTSYDENSCVLASCSSEHDEIPADVSVSYFLIDWASSSFLRSLAQRPPQKHQIAATTPTTPIPTMETDVRGTETKKVVKRKKGQDDSDSTGVGSTTTNDELPNAKRGKGAGPKQSTTQQQQQQQQQQGTASATAASVTQPPATPEAQNTATTTSLTTATTTDAAGQKAATAKQKVTRHK
jgi:hypothetical protein